MRRSRGEFLEAFFKSIVLVGFKFVLLGEVDRVTHGRWIIILKVKDVGNIAGRTDGNITEYVAPWKL